MITVRITGLVIPSANNIVNYVFVFYFKQTSQRRIYIFQQDITPNKVNACVYSRDYFLTVREPYK